MKNVLVKINGVDKDYHRLPFGRQIEDIKKIRLFCQSALSYHVGAKHKPTLPAVKQWLKEKAPSEYYASWEADHYNYKDDSVQVFYKD